jgi:hypothetical protein
MAGGESSQAIVRTWSDQSCGTGESYYQTADGQVWKTCRFFSPHVTGVSYGTVKKGRMHPRPG